MYCDYNISVNYSPKTIVWLQNTEHNYYMDIISYLFYIFGSINHHQFCYNKLKRCLNVWNALVNHDGIKMLAELSL